MPHEKPETREPVKKEGPSPVMNANPTDNKPAGLEDGGQGQDDIIEEADPEVIKNMEFK